MIDIYNFVATNIFPNIPSDLYFLIPIGCIIVLVFVLMACIMPFALLFSLMKR